MKSHSLCVLASLALVLPPGQIRPLRAAEAETPKAVDILDEEGFSKLHRAAIGGHLDDARKLLEAGADVNVRQGTFFGTPLQYAASSGHADMIKLLIEYEAKLEAADSHGRTPLMWAATNGRSDAARALLVAGAQVNAATEGGWTPLHYAAQAGHIDVAKLLIQHDARVDATRSQGNTPLMSAADKGHTELVRVLLDAGAEVNAVNDGGWRALHYAAQGGHTKTAEILIEQGALTEARNIEGKTPADLWPPKPGSDIPQPAAASYPRPVSARPSGDHGPETLPELSGLLRKSVKSASPYYLDLDGGNSFLLRGKLLDRVEPGTRVWVAGPIQTELQGFGSAPNAQARQWQVYMQVRQVTLIGEPFERPGQRQLPLNRQRRFNVEDE